jgi:hypothetical protein
MWSCKIKTYEEDLMHFVIYEQINKNLKEFGWKDFLVVIPKTRI